MTFPIKEVTISTQQAYQTTKGSRSRPDQRMHKNQVIKTVILR
jgi:hypothetical protein